MTFRPATGLNLTAQNWYVSKAGNDSSGDGSQGNPFLTIGKVIATIADFQTSNYIFVGPGEFDELNTFAFRENLHLIGAGKTQTIIARSNNSAIPFAPDTTNSNNVYELYLDDIWIHFPGIVITRTEPAYVATETNIVSVNVGGNEITIASGLSLPATSPTGLNLVDVDIFGVINYTNYDSGTGILSGLTFPFGNVITDFSPGEFVVVAIPEVKIVADACNITKCIWNGVGVGANGGFFNIGDFAQFTDCDLAMVTLKAVHGFFKDCTTFPFTLDSQGTLADNSNTHFILDGVTHRGLTCKNTAVLIAQSSPFEVNDELLFIGGLTLRGANARIFADADSSRCDQPITLQSGALLQNLIITTPLDDDYRFTYPADGSLIDPDDIGKLMMDDGSGTAKVYNVVAAIPATTDVLVNEPSTIAVAQTEANFRFLFHSQPNANEYIDLFANGEQAGSGGGSQPKFVVGAPGANEVQIGATISDTINNLITYWNTQNPVTSGRVLLASNEPGEHSLTVTANPAMINGIEGNLHFDNTQFRGLVGSFDQTSGIFTWPYSTTAPYLNLSGTMELLDVSPFTNDSGATYRLGPQNGVDAIPASTIHLVDTLFGDVFNLTAGVDWTPGATPGDEVTAILAAAAAGLAAANWMGINNGDSMTFTANTAGFNPISLTTPGGLDGIWATVTSTYNGANAVTNGIPLGKLLSFTGGQAILAESNGQTFIGSGSITLGDYLRGANDGKVGTGDPDTDFITGRALRDYVDGEKVQLGYAPRNPTNWFVSTPKSIEQALTWLNEHGINDRGGYIANGPLTIDNSSADVTNLNLIFDSNVLNEDVYQIHDLSTLVFSISNTGTPNVHGHVINEVADPASAQDAATKAYVDTGLAGKATASTSAEQDLGTLVWTAGVAPSGTIHQKYRWSQVDKKVDLWVKIDAGTAGTAVLSVDFALPGDLPAPGTFASQPASTIIAYGTGNLTTAANSAIAAAGDSKLYFDAGSAARVTIETAVALAGKFAWAHVSYLTA